MLKTATQNPNRYYSYSPRHSIAVPKSVHTAHLKASPVRNHHGLLLGAFLILGISFVSFNLFRKSPVGPSNTESSAIAVKAAQKEEEPKLPPATDTTQMQAEINALIAANPHLQISVSYVDLTHNKTGHLGVDAAYIGASVSKILTATFYLNQVEEGKTTLDKVITGGSARTQMEKMITISDNTSWWNLNRYMGKNNLQAYATGIGLASYSADTNTITSQDVALLFQKLYKGDLVNQEHRQLLLGFMEQANRRELLVAGLPAGVKSYHKAGWLEDRAHDAMIVDDSNNPYVLIVFSKSNRVYNQAEGSKLFQQISAAAAKAFIGPQVTNTAP